MSKWNDGLTIDRMQHARGEAEASVKLVRGLKWRIKVFGTGAWRLENLEGNLRLNKVGDYWSCTFKPFGIATDYRRFKDPNAAVRHRLRLARKQSDEVVRLLTKCALMDSMLGGK